MLGMTTSYEVMLKIPTSIFGGVAMDDNFIY